MFNSYNYKCWHPGLHQGQGRDRRNRCQQQQHWYGDNTTFIIKKYFLSFFSFLMLGMLKTVYFLAVFVRNVCVSPVFSESTCKDTDWCSAVKDGEVSTAVYPSLGCGWAGRGQAEDPGGGGLQDPA